MIIHTCTLRIETKDTATAVFMDIAVSVLTAFEERRQGAVQTTLCWHKMDNRFL